MKDKEYKEDFLQYKSSIINDLKRKDYVLQNEFERNFKEISSRNYNFLKNEERIKIIEKLSLAEVADFFEEKFLKNPIRLDVGFVSQGKIKENEIELIKNFERSYYDIVKCEGDNKKDENEEMEIENDNENEEEEEEESLSEKSFEMPKRFKIEDDSFKKELETFNFNLL